MADKIGTSERNVGADAPSPPSIEDRGGNVGAVQSDLLMLPDAVMQKLEDAGVSFVAVQEAVTEKFPELSGVGPRGYSDPLATFDTVPGVFKNSTVVVATSGKYGHGSYSLTLHETGHAYDQVAGRLSRSRRFISAYNKDYFALTKYEQQSGNASRSEAFAESFANYFKGNDLYKTSHPALFKYWDTHIPPPDRVNLK